jgi:hypothetical protein
MRKACIRDRSVRGFSWCVRRVSAQSPVPVPPFPTTRRAVRFDRRGVDRQGHAVRAAVGQRLEDRPPMSALGPPIEAIVDGRVRTVFRRTIAPACAALKHMDDAAHDAPVVIALRTTLVCRQMRLDPPPLLVAQPEQSHTHLKSPLAESLCDEGITAGQLGTSPKHHGSSGRGCYHC